MLTGLVIIRPSTKPRKGIEPSCYNGARPGRPANFVPLSVVILMQRFALRHEILLTDSSGIIQFGVMQSLQHEDGSGRSYNVTLSPSAEIGGGPDVTFHVRCHQ